MTDQLQKKNQKRLQFWQEHIKAWAFTELSQREYCRQNNLKTNRFTYWKRKLQKDSLPVEFIQIPVEPVQPDHLFCNNETFLRLTVNSRLTIEIPDGFTSATLKQVLLTLEEI